jgi:hypothetical protein
MNDEKPPPNRSDLKNLMGQMDQRCPLGVFILRVLGERQKLYWEVSSSWLLSKKN